MFVPRDGIVTFVSLLFILCNVMFVSPGVGVLSGGSAERGEERCDYKVSFERCELSTNEISTSMLSNAQLLTKVLNVTKTFNW